MDGFALAVTAISAGHRNYEKKLFILTGEEWGRERLREKGTGRGAIEWVTELAAIYSLACNGAGRSRQ